jgi:hypothetical protein
MGYGVNQTWASPLGRAPGAGSSRGGSTRTAKAKRSSSARRAPSKRKKTSSPKRRGLQKAQSARDYHAQGIGAKPVEWGGTLAQWIAYRTDKTGKAPGYWL